MRFVAPARAAVDQAVFLVPPLAAWDEYADWLRAADWPHPDALNAAPEQAGSMRLRFVAQTRELLADGLHYEERIAQRGEIATRERNWHDLMNALVWLRYPALKSALNARQVAEIARVGPKRRTRAQCALTHFDEAGVIVRVLDPMLVRLWDAHDWEALFVREAAAWRDGRIGVDVFGHALLEHALRPGQLLVGKAVVIAPANGCEATASTLDRSSAVAQFAAAIRTGALLNDPQELRPLPLSGIPGWHAGNESEDFYRSAQCFRPLRLGRFYPRPLHGGEA